MRPRILRNEPYFRQGSALQSGTFVNELDQGTFVNELDHRKNSLEAVFTRTLTEFLSVFCSLVCFSRLGAFEPTYKIVRFDNTTGVLVPEYESSYEPSLAANLVLFVTLVVFQFPFMNGYIVFTYDRCVIGGFHPGRILLCFWLEVCHGLGVLAACGVIWTARNWKGIVWNAPQGAATDEDFHNYGFEASEEFFAVTVLLVGYIHLTYNSFKKVGIFGSKEHLFSKFSDATKQRPIPLEFILHMTLLVTAVLRCFPSAHLSPHVSLYLLLMQYSSPARFGCRIGGGVGAFVVTWAMFWFVYQKRTQAHGEPGAVTQVDGLPSPAIALGVKDPMPSARREEARRLLDNTDFDDAGHSRDSGDTAAPKRLVGDVPATPSSAGLPGAPAISFNNAYRHVYRAM